MKSPSNLSSFREAELRRDGLVFDNGATRQARIGTGTSEWDWTLDFIESSVCGGERERLIALIDGTIMYGHDLWLGQ